MRILLSGSSGLIGNALFNSLNPDEHLVVRLTRPNSHPVGRHINWNPDAGEIDPDDLENFDAVVHLSGETIMGRWTAEKKERILHSRVKSTLLLCQTLAELRSRPKVLVAASAVGFYGDRGDEVLDEKSPPGTSFLADVAKAWEGATESAKSGGIRVVNFRFGFVLSKEGGGLASMLLPFKLGLGGRVGSGRQYLSWIAIDDIIGAIMHIIGSGALSGPVNAVSPQPLTNCEFTKALGSVLSRPTIFPLPAFAARMMFGEMADGLLLASARVQPSQLIASGYQFRFSEIKTALRHVLGKS